jgi:hypothetical protein
MLLVKVGKFTINMEQVREIREGSYLPVSTPGSSREELLVFYSHKDITYIREPEHVAALRSWLAERSIDLLKAQAVAA